MMILQEILLINITYHQYALIDNKPFFDQPVKNKQKVYEKLIAMSGNNEYTQKIYRLFVSSKIL